MVFFFPPHFCIAPCVLADLLIQFLIHKQILRLCVGALIPANCSLSEHSDAIMARGDAPRAEALTLRSGKSRRQGRDAPTIKYSVSEFHTSNNTSLHYVVVFFFVPAPWMEDDCIKGAYCCLRIPSSLSLRNCRAPVFFRSIQRQQLTKRPENRRPCHSKTNAGTFCIRCGFCPSVCLSHSLCLLFSPFFLFPPLALCAFQPTETNLLPLLQPKDTQCSVTGIIKLLQR